MSTQSQATKKLRLAILTSGGDAPGMNAAIRAATMLAEARGAEVYGVEQGYRGLIEGHLRPLPRDEVAGIMREGGTIILRVMGLLRCGAFDHAAGAAASPAKAISAETTRAICKRFGRLISQETGGDRPGSMACRVGCG